MSKVKLNQIVALNAPKKADFQKLITKYYHIMQKSEPFFGLERQYTPRDENGEQLPPESSRVQLKVKELLDDLKEPWANMFDVILTNDLGNCQAKSDIIIDGKIVAKDIPVSTLLFLEKQLDHWKEILNKIPLLPLSDDWSLNSTSGFYETPVHQTIRTKKINKPIVLYDATDKHPAQTAMVTEDINVGTWNVKKLSSALSMIEVDSLKTKLNKLREAVIIARETANSLEIDQIKQGENILDYLFS